MKTIKSVFSILLCFFTIFASAFAQTEIPTTSIAQARADAILASTGVEVWANSSGSNGSPGAESSWLAGAKNSAEILSLAKVSLKIETVDPTASIQTQVTVVNKEGEVLFEGYTNVKPELIGGVWTLPKSAGEIQLRMPWARWLTLSKSVNQAWIVARNQEGFESFYELAVSGSKILFPTASLGLKNAYVKSNFSDGTSMSWTISDGKQRQVTSITASVSSRFEDVVQFKNQSVQVTGQSVTHIIPVTKGVGVIPTFEIIQYQEGVVSMDISTSAGGRPSGYLFRAPGTNVWTPWPVSALGNTTPLRALKGTTYIVPQFKPEILTEQSSPTQTGGNGKG